jgi:GT2 family glycosyltransferase
LEWSFIARTIFTFCCKKFLNAVIYVADNASTDASLLMLKHISISVRIVKTKAIWALHGYNEALKQVDAELYALVNSDIEVTENWLQPILTTFKRTQYAIIQPKILDFKTKNTLNMLACCGFIDQFGYPYCRIFDTIERTLASTMT